MFLDVVHWTGVDIGIVVESKSRFRLQGVAVVVEKTLFDLTVVTLSFDFIGEMVFI